MPKLNDTQLVILAAAAKRKDGSILPAPKRLKLDEQALTRVLKGLLKRKLVAEAPAVSDAAVWRRGEDGARIGLTISESGLQAIGIGPEESSDSKAAAKESGADEQYPRKAKQKKGAKESKKEAAPDSKIRPNTKQATVIELLRRSAGATVDELTKATGWQPHSVRGVMSGTLKKKLKLKIANEKTEGRGRVYRIAERG